MYKKAVSGLVLLYFIFLFSALCVRGISQNRQNVAPVGQSKSDERAQCEGSTMGIAKTLVSGQRVMQVQGLTESDPYELEEGELEILMRIVEAEAGNQDSYGKLLVANVVLNRVENEAFPDNVSDVVLQNVKGHYQFSPVSSGTIWTVNVSEETAEAVERALAGEDVSDGALYFAARKHADEQKMKWFDEHLTYLFAYGGHEFFR